MKILLIDDNKEITDAVSFYLEADEVFCTIINNGREGLKIIVVILISFLWILQSLILADMIFWMS